MIKEEILNNLRYDIIENNMKQVKCNCFYQDMLIGHCIININIYLEATIWEISSWYIDNKDYKHMGIGTLIMKHTLQYIVSKYGLPSRVDYIWNGANSYVFDWLETNFNPICKCPLAILKTQSDDDLDSHIYFLDVNKFLQYFELV